MTGCPGSLATTGLWRDAVELPESLAATLAAPRDDGELAALLTRPGTRRIVATGNGASYYVAHALWLASLQDRRAALEVVPVPGGLLAAGAFAWRPGDVLLAVSSSGELRDVLEALEVPGCPTPFGLITAAADSSLGRRAGARALVRVLHERGLTHTQAYCGGLLAALALWSRVARDSTLEAVLQEAPARVARALAEAEVWAPEAVGERPSAAVAFGTGLAWTAALEAALLLAEVPGIPCAGMETREGATTGMYALAPGQLALSLPLGSPDPRLEEAEAVCASRGAKTLRAPVPAGDARLAALLAFPAPLALAVELARQDGRDPDHPSWRDTYYATARRSA